MAFNNSRERNKLNRRIAKDVGICEQQGASKETIEMIVQEHKKEYLNNRSEGEMTCSIEPMVDVLGSSKDDPYYMIEGWLEKKKPKREGFPWLSSFTCQELYDALMQFTDAQLKIVELLGIRKMKQAEAAEILGMSQGEISKEWNVLKNTIRASVPREISNRFRL